MNRKNIIMVSYLKKNKNGFMVEKKQKFNHTDDAYFFIKFLLGSNAVIGKPIMEIR